jgi:hypothetical protein
MLEGLSRLYGKTAPSWSAIIERAHCISELPHRVPPINEGKLVLDVLSRENHAPDNHDIGLATSYIVKPQHGNRWSPTGADGVCSRESVLSTHNAAALTVQSPSLGNTSGVPFTGE